jgi:hypothetical protein
VFYALTLKHGMGLLMPAKEKDSGLFASEKSNGFTTGVISFIHH